LLFKFDWILFDYIKKKEEEEEEEEEELQQPKNFQNSTANTKK
jgi:hypothetical protein